MFVITLTYIKPITEVEKYLEEHRQFLDTYYSKGYFIASGPKLPRDGGIILVKSISKELLASILHNDPFYVKKIADYAITEFKAVKYADCISHLI